MPFDVLAPVATPFRPNWSSPPRTDFQFRTGIFTAADGREQRYPQLRRPKVSVQFEHLATGTHAGRAWAMMGNLMNRAIAVRDFRMNATGRVAPDGVSVSLSTQAFAYWWPVGTRIVIEDRDGAVEHTAIITASDPLTRTLAYDAPAPEAMRGRVMTVGSAVVASLDEEQSGKVWHSRAAGLEVRATAFNGVDAIGGAPLDVFPLKHGDRDAMTTKFTKQSRAVDFGIGRRQEATGYASWVSGFRQAEVQSYQLDAAQKQALVSFYCGVRGRLGSFQAPDILEGARFRFASDTLTIEHLNDQVSKATAPIIQVVE